ncbi:MAG TPA: hypothetical protein VGN05_02425 [Parvibaculum sp.]
MRQAAYIALRSLIVMLTVLPIVIFLIAIAALNKYQTGSFF